MIESDLAIAGLKKWPFSRVRIQPTGTDAISLRIEP
jgi:hypothetical protein